MSTTIKDEATLHIRKARTELVEGLKVDTLERLAWEGTQQRPGEVERAVNVAGLVVTLSDELVLELVEKLEVEQILRCERLLTNDRFHRLHVLADGVVGILQKKKKKKN